MQGLNEPRGALRVFERLIEDTSRPTDQPFVNHLNRVINGVVRVLAALMALLIVMGAGNVLYSIYTRIDLESGWLPDTSDIFAIFGAFLVVLIAMEIFVNITIYLREDVIHVNIVMATALMAVARKVIILDYEKTDPLTVLGLAALVLAMSVGYWLVVSRSHEWQMGHGRTGEPGEPSVPANGKLSEQGERAVQV